MKIEDVMTRDPSFVTPETSARDAARMMKEEDVGIIPVVDAADSRRLVGVVTDRDLAIRIVAEGRDADTRVVQVMSSDRITTCTPDAELDDAMNAMASEKVRRIPIVDDSGALVGIVSQADVVREASDDRKAERTIERISEPGGQHSQ